MTMPVIEILSLLLLLLLLSCLPPSLEEKVTVTVKGATTIASTDENFICATLDWWPPEKCNYDQCPWGNSSIENLDLNNTILNNAVNAFKSLRFRIGGSLQDQVIYKVGRHAGRCEKFKLEKDGLFGFSNGCLTMDRWDRVNHSLNKTGAIVTFGLNALNGRQKASQNDGLYLGNWDPSNAQDFINYTISKGYKIESWEFGNELCGSGVSGRVEPGQYGEDVLVLSQVIENLYFNSTTKPNILAPGGFFDQQWFAQFLQTTGPDVVAAVTHHIYNLGPGDDRNLIYKIQDPYYLSQIAQTYSDAEVTVRNFAPWASAWIGEAGGAFNSGGKYVSHTFADSFWYMQGPRNLLPYPSSHEIFIYPSYNFSPPYLDQLGMASTFDHKVFCRQALIGGNYALLNTTTFVPNPDYYGALLWHRLMGPGVLSATHFGSPYLRVYSHCSKQKPGIVVVLINLSNSTSFDVSVVNDMNLYPPEDDNGDEPVGRREYHLTPRDGNIQSDVLLLNGSPVRLTSTKDIPVLDPIVVDASSPIFAAPHSIVFAHLEDFNAPACS